MFNFIFNLFKTKDKTPLTTKIELCKKAIDHWHFNIEWLKEAIKQDAEVIHDGCRKLVCLKDGNNHLLTYDLYFGSDACSFCKHVKKMIKNKETQNKHCQKYCPGYSYTGISCGGINRGPGPWRDFANVVCWSSESGVGKVDKQAYNTLLNKAEKVMDWLDDAYCKLMTEHYNEIGIN